VGVSCIDYPTLLRPSLNWWDVLDVASSPEGMCSGCWRSHSFIGYISTPPSSLEMTTLKRFTEPPDGSAFCFDALQEPNIEYLETVPVITRTLSVYPRPL
jgi:hypothetical protein